MPTIGIHGQEIYYAHHRGPAGAPAVLLIHGAGGSRLNWPPALRRLPGVAVYVPDLPGHGRSEGPGRRSVAAYADVIEGLLAQVEAQEVVVVGHSLGGAIAQTLALRGLPRLAGLVLLATGARLPVSERILESPPEAFPEIVDFMVKYGWAPQTPAEMKDLARDFLMQNNPATLQGDFVACDRFDIRGELGQIRVPTLVIGGTADRMTPLKFSAYLADQIPEARLVTVEGGGHMVALEQPGAVADPVRTFVEEVAGKGG